MKFTVGGESFDLTAQEVIAAMRGVPVEAIREHVVEIDGRLFPPKQVFAATVARASAAVLHDNGGADASCGASGSFVDAPVRLITTAMPGRGRWTRDGVQTGTLQARLADIESALGTVQAAIAGLRKRVNDLEATR